MNHRGRAILYIDGSTVRRRLISSVLEDHYDVLACEDPYSVMYLRRQGYTPHLIVLHRGEDQERNTDFVRYMNRSVLFSGIPILMIGSESDWPASCRMQEEFRWRLDSPGNPILLEQRIREVFDELTGMSSVEKRKKAWRETTDGIPDPPMERDRHRGEILLLGWDRDRALPDHLLPGSGDAISWKYMEIPDLASASNTHEKPYAVLIPFSFLTGRESGFIKGLRDICGWNEIPILAYSPDSEVPDLHGTVNLRGCDDVFHSGMQWARLRSIIDFLRTYINWSLSKQPHRDNSYLMAGYSLKRLFDITLSLVSLIILSPFMILICLLIKLESRGPVIYVSKRIGEGFKTIDFFKFRSMYNGAEHDLAMVAHLNHNGNLAVDETHVFYKIRSDPRVTTFGKVLRATSLDELPQLINVLKGDMSIVGNRPLPEYEAVGVFREEWLERYLAPAGITGLWQVSGKKNRMKYEERIELDVEYARNPSLLADMRILWKTIPAMMQRESP